VNNYLLSWARFRSKVAWNYWF